MVISVHQSTDRIGLGVYPNPIRFSLCMDFHNPYLPDRIVFGFGFCMKSYIRCLTIAAYVAQTELRLCARTQSVKYNHPSAFTLLSAIQPYLVLSMYGMCMYVSLCMRMCVIFIYDSFSSSFLIMISVVLVNCRLVIQILSYSIG